MNQELAIEVRDIQKSFERFMLGPLSLNVPTGAIYALIGPNGAGKTTTLDVMFGMGAPDHGKKRPCLSKVPVINCWSRTGISTSISMDRYLTGSP